MPSRHLIDPAQVERFRADLTALTGTRSGRVGLAVSGGGDSLALLLLAHAAFPDNVAVATVDHGLRVEAAGEAAGVAALCATLQIPHTVLIANSRASATGNTLGWARITRYRLLADWAQASAIHHVATAHHRDDVAETFLMRAARGGGVRSLAAMPAVRALAASPVLLVRPLLGWTRIALAAIVAAAGVEPAVDATNSDARFARARIRRVLATAPDLPATGLARAAANLRDVEEALEWLLPRELATRWEEQDGEVSLRPDDLPFELKRRLAARAIEAVRRRSGLLAPWRETALPGLVRALDAGGGGTVADVSAIVRDGRWRFRLISPRQSG